MCHSLLGLFCAFFFVRTSVSEIANAPWQLTEFVPTTPPSSCSEFVHIRNSKASNDRRVLLLCDEQTDEQFGFRGLEVECSPRDGYFRSTDGQSKATGYVGEKLFVIPTRGRVKRIKSFVVSNRSFVVVLLEHQHSILFELLENDKKLIQIIKLQTIPYNYLSDATAVYVSTGDVYVAFAAFEPEGVDKTRQQEMIAPVYRLHNGRLKLCDFASVTRSVSVRGWEHQGGFPTFAYASYMDKESDKSVINFFDVFMDEEGSCRVVERHFQSSIRDVDDRQLCGVQAIEVFQKSATKYLAVALSPVNQNHDCGRHALTESFILQSDEKARHRFMTDRYIRFPAPQTRFSGFHLVTTSCKEDVILAYGYLSKTQFFTAEQFDNDNTVFLKRIARLDTPPNLWHSSVGYCNGQRPMLALSRPDLIGVPVFELHCGNIDGPQTRTNRSFADRTETKPYNRLSTDDMDLPLNKMLRNMTFPTHVDVTPETYFDEIEKIDRGSNLDPTIPSSDWHGIASYKLWKKKQRPDLPMYTKPMPLVADQNLLPQTMQSNTESPFSATTPTSAVSTTGSYITVPKFQNLSMPALAFPRPSFRTLSASPNLFLTPSMLNGPGRINTLPSSDSEPETGMSFDPTMGPSVQSLPSSEMVLTQEQLIQSSHIPPEGLEPKPSWLLDSGNTTTMPPMLHHQSPSFARPESAPMEPPSQFPMGYQYPNPYAGPTVPVTRPDGSPYQSPPYPQPQPMFEYPMQPPVYYPEMNGFRMPFPDQGQHQYSAQEHVVRENGRWGGGKSKGLRRYRRKISAPV